MHDTRKTAGETAPKNNKGLEQLIAFLREDPFEDYNKLYNLLETYQRDMRYLSESMQDMLDWGVLSCLNESMGGEAVSIAYGQCRVIVEVFRSLQSKSSD